MVLVLALCQRASKNVRFEFLIRINFKTKNLLPQLTVKNIQIPDINAYRYIYTAGNFEIAICLMIPSNYFYLFCPVQTQFDTVSCRAIIICIYGHPLTIHAIKILSSEISTTHQNTKYRHTNGYKIPIWLNLCSDDPIYRVVVCKMTLKMMDFRKKETKPNN